MATESAQPGISLAGEISPDLLRELREVARVEPYHAGDDQRVVLADGAAGGPLLSDPGSLAQVLESGRQLVVVNPRREQLSLLADLTGAAVGAPEVDMVSYRRLPGEYPTARPPCHVYVVPSRVQNPGAAGTAAFGAADVVAGVRHQALRFEEGTGSPIAEMFPPGNNQAIFQFTPFTIQPVFGTWDLPEWYGQPQTQQWQISLECDVFSYYVNGDPRHSPYYLVVVMMYPSFLTGASFQWFSGFPAGTGITPYFLQNAGASLRSWSAGNGGSALPLSGIAISPSAPTAGTRPTAPGQQQLVTVALGQDGAGGLPVPMYSDSQNVWVVPPWATSSAAQTMNITADLRLDASMAGESEPWAPGWLFQTEWLYHRTTQPGTSSLVGALFRPPMNVSIATTSLYPLPASTSWRDMTPPFLNNWSPLFIQPSGTLVTPPVFGPATLSGLSEPSNNPALYAVAMVGPNLSAGEGGWVNGEQYFPAPPASVSFQPQLYEVLTCVGHTSTALNPNLFWFWTAQAIASSFPRLGVTLNPPPGVSLSTQEPLPVTLSSGGAAATVTVNVTGVNTFSGNVTLAVSIAGPTGDPPAVSVSPASVSLTPMGSTQATVTVTPGTTTGQFIATLTASATGLPNPTTLAISITVSS